MLTTSVPGGNRRYGRYLPTSPFQRRIKKKYDILHKFAGDLLSISLCALIASHASHTRAFSPLSPLSHASHAQFTPVTPSHAGRWHLCTYLKPQASSLKPQPIAKIPLFHFVSFRPLRLCLVFTESTAVVWPGLVRRFSVLRVVSISTQG